MRSALILFLCWFLILPPAFGTFGDGVQWDVETTGADTNGGAFDAGVGSPGTDESQGAGTAMTITLTGTTTGTCSPACTSTTHGPGNFFQDASGAGCSAGTYEILSQSAGIVTLDHAMGSISNACVGVLGGPNLTIGHAANLAITSNTIWVKSGTYTITTEIGIKEVIVSGYGSTHGDGGTAPLVTTATNSTNIFATTGSSTTIWTILNNLSLSNTAGTPKYGFDAKTRVAAGVYGVKFSGFTYGINSDSDGNLNSLHVKRSEFTGCTTDAIIYTSAFPFGEGMLVEESNFHANSGNSISVKSGGAQILRNLFWSNTLGPIVYTSVSNPSLSVISNSFYSNTGACLTYSPNLTKNSGPFENENNIYYGCGTYGVNATAVPAFQFANNNAYGNNGTANYNVGSIAGANDVTLTALPYTNGGSGDLSLNSTVGGGAALKGLGYPGLFPGGTTTGYIGIGAVESPGAGLAVPQSTVYGQ